MAPRSWATNEQQTFLISHLDEFFDMQSSGKLASFWAQIQNSWFQWWPEAGMEGAPSTEPVNLTLKIQERNKV